MFMTNTIVIEHHRRMCLGHVAIQHIYTNYKAVYNTRSQRSREMRIVNNVRNKNVNIILEDVLNVCFESRKTLLQLRNAT